jgi:hypothetical protein
MPATELASLEAPRIYGGTAQGTDAGTSVLVAGEGTQRSDVPQSKEQELGQQAGFPVTTDNSTVPVYPRKQARN